MTTEPQTARQATAPMAALAALFTVVLSRVLFPLAQAGPWSTFFLFTFPFVTGGAALFAGRYAFAAWRTTTNVAFRALIVVALLADIVVFGFAVIMGLLILNGPIVA